MILSWLRDSQCVSFMAMYWLWCLTILTIENQLFTFVHWPNRAKFVQIVRRSHSLQFSPCKMDSKLEQRAKFCVKLGETQKDTITMIESVYGANALGHTQIWM